MNNYQADIIKKLTTELRNKFTINQLIEKWTECLYHEGNYSIKYTLVKNNNEIEIDIEGVSLEEFDGGLLTDVSAGFESLHTLLKCYGDGFKLDMSINFDGKKLTGKFIGDITLLKNNNIKQN